MNKYNLDVELTQEQKDQYWEDLASKGVRSLGRRVEEYWSVHHLGIDHDTAAKRICDAYGIPEDRAEEICFREGAFITDDEDLAIEMISILNMDFVYDFKSGLFIMDAFAHHEITMGNIWEAVKGEGAWFEVSAEKYVAHGMGCFMSSVRPYIYIGEDVAVPSIFNRFRNRIQRM